MTHEAVPLFSANERRHSMTRGVLQRLANRMAAARVYPVKRLTLGPCAGGCFDGENLFRCDCSESRKIFALSAEAEGTRFDVVSWRDAEGYWMCGRRANERRAYPHLLFQRHLVDAPFVPDDGEHLLRILPETLDILASSEELSLLRNKMIHIGEVFERLPLPLILIDEQLRILAANAMGVQLLERDDGLGLRHGMLKVTRAVASQLAAAVEGGDHLHLDVVRPSGATPYVLRLLSTGGSDTGQPLAALVVRDADAMPKQPCPVVGKVFGLTRAESRLAHQLVRGNNLLSAAGELGITQNTARTHMKRIYAKTGVRRQADLVRLLSGMMTEV